MEYLPVEVLSQIFKFLTSLEDRKAASLVCRQWYNAYQSPCFRDDEVLDIISSENFDELAELENQNRIFCHVIIRSVDVTESSLKFWNRYGPYIKTLYFLGCDIREKFFINLMKICDRLESLCLQECTDLFISGLLLDDEEEKAMLQRKLSGLKILNLGYNRYLSDSMFVRLASVCENIEELLLPGCHVSFHPGLYHKFYLRNGQMLPSESVFTFPVIFDFIQGHARKLRRLSFCDTLIDSDAISSIAQISNLSLEAFYLRRCQQLTNDGIIRLSNFQSSLTHLDLTLCPRITDLSLLIVCSRLTQLKYLSIHGCRAITDLGISDIWNLTKLKRLNISECELIHDEGIIRGLCTKKNENLEELYLSHLGLLSHDSIVLMLEYVPNLRVLDLGYCYNAVTDKAVQSICSKAKYLRSLTLTMCQRLTDTGLTGVPLKTTQSTSEATSDNAEPSLGSKAELTVIKETTLKQGVKQRCANLDLNSDENGISVANLKYLQHLNLSGCNCISDVSLKYALRFKDLRILDMSFCQQISAEGISYVSENNRSIENLNLDNCHNIDDKGICHILKNLKRLKSLIIGSSRITDNIVDYICKEAGSLNHLDVRHCTRLSASAVNKIMKMTENLSRLHVKYFCNARSNNFYEVKFLAPPPPPLPPNLFFNLPQN